MALEEKVSVLDTATSSLLEALSETPAQQLAILLTQHGAALPKHAQRALRILARRAIYSLTPLQLGSPAYLDAERLTNVLRRLIARGDPSQARRLVPTPAALVDLAICGSNARDILARLVDEQGGETLLKAAVMAYDRASASQSRTHIARAAFVLARLLSALPRWAHTVPSASRRGTQHTSTTKTAAAYPDARETIRLLSSLQDHYGSFHIIEPIASAEKGNLMAKIVMLEVAWSLFERQSISGFKASSLTGVDKLIQAVPAAAVSSAKTPLVDLSLLADLAVIKPTLMAMLQNSVSHSSSLDALARQVNNIKADFAAESGAGWAHVATLLRGSPHSAAVNKDCGYYDNADLIAVITAVLPQWKDRVSQLREKLQEPHFVGQSNDTIVQMLMDEGATPAPIDTFSNTVDTNGAMELLRQRANVFDNDDEALHKATLLYRGAKGKRRAGQEGNSILGAGLSDDLKAAILARAAAPDSDEEEDSLGWNPFADEAPLEVGFEEELGDDVDVQDAGRHVAPRRTTEEGSDTEEGEAEGRHAEADYRPRIHEPTTASGSTTPTPTQVATSDRVAERMLITAWKESGEAHFSKDSRRTKARTALLSRLNASSAGKRWDDQLVESWATMFARNPRKDKLLAAVDDVMRLGNPNHRGLALTEQDDDAEGHAARGFGLDRGRGGRVLGPGRGGSTGRGSPGSGSQSGSRGGGSGRGTRGRGSNNKNQRGGRGQSRGHNAGGGRS